MGFFTLQPTMVSIILSGLLSVPSVTPHTAGSDGIPQASVKIEESADNSVILHSLTISGLSSKDTEENIILDSPVHLKLECILKADSMPISNLTWIHGEEEINKDRYSENNTAGEWRTTLEVSVADVNSTGSYACIFSSTTEAKATFYIKVPGVHSGGKTLVTYNGDSTVLKCDSFKYKPVEWLWYKVNENEQVLLTISSESSRFKQDNKTANETKLHISGLTEGDSGAYVCKAVYKTGESEGQVEVNVLSLMVPFKVFLAIVAEVAVLVGIILGYELLSKKKHSEEEVKSEDEQMANLKSEENGKSEESTTRQRKA
ncbi:embigin [Rana temporaria]|uniref:embigin n=1 Tax=Rana temporaria TaxID=8407 RepID=UPI001AAD8064|nr:embigin [Rana temporaria]XP_040195146.1 embigin [Rana temporaria]